LLRLVAAPVIPVDPSVIDGRCYVCRDPVEVPAAVADDVVGNALPAGSMPDDVLMVRMCDECLADFVRWQGEQATSTEGGRRSDA
jgi:hypothetical protein